MRDDFSVQVKEVLAKRVGYLCSNPRCRQLTSGPRLEGGAINVGVAAHIKAASPSGPRFDSTMSADERKAEANGIWLCQKCGKLVDSDAPRYSVELLNQWRTEAEQAALKALENRLSHIGYFAEHSLSSSAKFKAGIIIIILFFLALSPLYISVPRQKDSPSLVIRPFENYCPQYNYLAKALPEDILDRIVPLRKLNVLIREPEDAPGKLRKKGIDYILKGAIHCAAFAQPIRVVIQLIDTTTGRLTAESDEFFNIDQLYQEQPYIAQTVARWLIDLDKGEQNKLSLPPTKNGNAYLLYLQGQASDPMTENDAKRQVNLFEGAVRLDPRFALAHAQLSLAHTAMYENGFDRSPKRLLLARRAFERSLAINPGLAQAHFAKAYFLFTQGAFEAALKELKLVDRELPRRRVLILAMQGFSRWIGGQAEEAARLLEQANDVSPDDYTSGAIAWNLGTIYREMRRFDKADYWYSHAIALDPDAKAYHLAQSINQLRWSGTVEAARTLLPNNFKWDDSESVLHLFELDLLDGDFAGARKTIRGLKDDVAKTDWSFQPKDLLLAESYRLVGEMDFAIPLYNSAIRLLRQQLAVNPSDSRIHSSLGVALSGIQQHDDAVREGRLGVDLCRDAVYRPYRLLDLTLIYTALGERELAIKQINSLLQSTSPLSPALLKIDPRWGSLRSDPRFQALVAPAK